MWLVVIATQLWTAGKLSTHTPRDNGEHGGAAVIVSLYVAACHSKETNYVSKTRWAPRWNGKISRVWEILQSSDDDTAVIADYKYLSINWKDFCPQILTCYIKAKNVVISTRSSKSVIHHIFDLLYDIFTFLVQRKLELPKVFETFQAKNSLTFALSISKHFIRQTQLNQLIIAHITTKYISNAWL